DPVAKAAREASVAAAALAAATGGTSFGIGGMGGVANDSIEAMLAKLETVYAAVSISQTVVQSSQTASDVTGAITGA
ncbi:hypothetical protein HDU67_004334, partial [Dinochytrium kinnereticum]